MKKLTSIILAVAILSSTFIFGIEKPLIAKAEDNAIQSFINETVELIRENDVDKDFIVDYEDEISTFSIHFEEIENYDFQTCRLIIQANKEIDKLNSVGIASGFLNYNIVQFATEEDAKTAYEYYLNCDYVISVSPERIYKPEKDYVVGDDKYITYEKGTPERLDFWGSKVTGTYDVVDYIESKYNVSDLPEIKVAVIDTGVDWNHPFLKGRIIKSGFSVAGNGENFNEYETEDGHGTSVAGVIVDNTPDNVKVSVYRHYDKNWVSSVSYTVTCLLKAFEEGANIINMSFGHTFLSGTEYNFLNDALEYVHSNGCVLTASSGNTGNDIDYMRRGPGGMESPITVAASNSYSMPTSWSTHGNSVDYMAPGEYVPVIKPNNRYRLSYGTSFSAPFTAASVALLMILYPDETNIQLERRLESSADKCDLAAAEKMYGYGILDVIGATELKRAPIADIQLAEGNYIDEAEITISVPEGCQVYYTINQTYPSKENGILYTEPFILKDDTTIVHTVSYSENCSRSDYVSKTYSVFTEGTDEMFEIGTDGIITAYNGTVVNLKIPDMINGIEVTGFAENLFSASNFYAVIFPQSVKTIPLKLFYSNKTIQSVEGVGITDISDQAFYSCTNLYKVNFPIVKTIGEKAFWNSTGLSGINFPECTYIGKSAFENTLVRYAYLPSVEIICFRAFYRCKCLYDLYVPSLIELRNGSYIGGTWQGASYAFDEGRVSCIIDMKNLEELSYGAFYASLVKRLEFSNVKKIVGMPIALCREPTYGTITVALPSTLKSISFDEVPLDDADENVNYLYSYKVYGTKGTFAERWAKENNFEFIEITPETAIITDLPDEYYSYMRTLEADVIGFNRIYQWYGTNTGRYNNAQLLHSGDKKSFDPNEYKQYKYYFCKVISTDVGYDPIEITSGICENKSYTYTPPTSNGSITIATPSNRYLKYGESINLYANATGLPKGAKIKWRIVEGSGVTLDPSVSGAICTVTSKSNGFVTIEAYAVNKNGNTLVNDKGNRICDREGISSEVSLWWIILYYLRQMFGITKTAINMIL